MFKEYGSGTDSMTFDDECDELAPDENESLDIVQPFMQDVNGELFASEILDFEIANIVSNNQNLDDEFDNYLNGFETMQEEPRIEMPKQRRCVSHKLNLMSKDFYNDLSGLAKSA